MARYHDIADALRTRIQSGEFAVGDKLPGISALQQEYDVPGLNTVRTAQQLLVEEGMLRTQQGVGAFVVSTKSLKQVDVIDTLRSVSSGVITALAALEAPRRVVQFDLDADEDLYFVLTEALREFAERQRGDADDEDRRRTDDDDTDRAQRGRRRWADIADTALDAVEKALGD